MGFRDDRVALQQRIEALQRDLTDERSQSDDLRRLVEVQQRELLRSRTSGARPIAWPSRPNPLLPVTLYCAIASSLIAPLLLSTAIAPARGFSDPDFARRLESPAPHPEVWAGQVLETDGQAPVAVDDQCQVFVYPTEPARRPDLCRLSVRCGDQELYAVDDYHGYAACGRLAPASGVVDVDVSWTDGDPSLLIDHELDLIELSSAEGWGARISIPERAVAPRAATF